MVHRLIGLAAAAALAVLPAPSEAIAPALLFMIKQVAQQAATSMVKDTLLSGLNGMGCKGMALSNALTMLDQRGGGLGTLQGGLQGTTIPPEVAAKMASLMPNAGQLPPGMALDPQQIAMMNNVLQMMNQPLSPADTVATIDALFELGFMPKAIQGEFKECMLLVPASVPALGMAMGMMKPMIPQLRQARDQLHALPPAEQDEVAAELARQLKALPADQRAALVEYLDAGFFPPRVAQGAKAGIGR